MSKRLFLHVGLPKSGTTYLQAVLAENKERLQERSRLLYPGATWDDQVLAARDALAADPHGVADPHVAGAWQRLVDEVSAWDGEAVVSMEWLGSAQPKQARRMVDSLAPTPVEVVISARDLARTIPAAWQEFVQNWETWSWAEFLGSITSETPRATPPGNLFWAQQDLGRVLSIWRDVVPAEQLHVVTLPRPGATAGELWSRFATVLGVDGSQFDASGRGSNESLGLESTAMMLRLNSISRVRGLEWTVYNEMFKHALAKRGLSKRKHQETSLGLPAELEEWTRARTAEHISAIRSSGAHVVGDVGDLDPVFGPGAQPDEVSSAALLDAALQGLVDVAQDRGAELTRLRDRNTHQREQIDERERRIGDLERHVGELGEEITGLEEWRARRDGAPAQRIRVTMADLSEQWSWLMQVRKVYWHVVNFARKVRNARKARRGRG